MRSFLILFIGLCIVAINSKAQTAFTGMRGLTSLEIAADMAPGINLYNTLDACANGPQGLESETYWGQPYTTKEMITSMKEKGFKSIRIPVTWWNHTGPYPEYKIDEAWMDRVEEVANYAFDNNMYVVINSHHDVYHENRVGSWQNTTYATQDTVTDQLVKIWTQIAERFKDYGDYLIFETMNEPREVGGEKEWTGGTPEHRDVVNQLNVAAVDAIRAVGGNNETRFIMVPQQAADDVGAIESLIIPNNDTNIIVSVHRYSPFNFCLNSEGTARWGTDNEIASLRQGIINLYDHFVSKGQAVILGEWGAFDKDNYADRVFYYDAYASVLKEYQVTPMVWIYPFNRKTLTWTDELVTKAMMRPYTNASNVESLTLSKKVDTLYIGEKLQLQFNFEPFEAVSPTDFVWESYDDDVATIDENGLISAVDKGRAEITLTTFGKRTDFKLVVLDTVTIDVQDNMLDNILVYPNPATTTLNIENKEVGLDAKLYTIDGKLINSLRGHSGLMQFDVSGLERGAYLLLLSTQNQAVVRKVMLIE